MDKVKWGIISTARIGIQKVVPAMQKGIYSEVVAIASRASDQARDAAAELKIPTYYGSYEELLNDPEIDAVYNPLPNHLHCQLSLEAMESGKHVLCEKPLGLTCEEIERLIETRDRCKVKAGEAFMVKSHPQWVDTLKRIRAGEIGTLQLVQGMFSYYNVDPANIRNRADIGGGGMWDIGCYPVTLSRFLFEEEPTQVAASFDYDPEMKIDRLSTVLMDFSKGKALFTVSTQLVPYQRMHMYGDKGHLEVMIPFNAPNDRPCVVRQDSGDILLDSITEHSFPAVDQYTLQADAFSQAILNDGEVPSTFEDALANTKVLVALFKAAQEKRWVGV